MFLHDYVTFWHLVWIIYIEFLGSWMIMFLLWHSSKVMSHWIRLTLIGHGWPWWHWMTMVYCILLCLILLDCDWLWLITMAIFYDGQHSSMVMLIHTFLIGYAMLLLSSWLSYMWKCYLPQWLCYIPQGWCPIAMILKN